jgi:hypothetical protein
MAHKPAVELTLVSIECVQMSESDGDEIYVNFTLDPEATPAGVKPMALASERVPANMEIWQMFNASKVTPNHYLYVGEIDQPVKLSVTVMEMDILEVIKNSLSVMGSWVDDFVGKVMVHIGTDGSHKWELGRHSNAEPNTPDALAAGLYRFRLMGNKSEYFVTLKLIVS